MTVHEGRVCEERRRRAFVHDFALYQHDDAICAPRKITYRLVDDERGETTDIAAVMLARQQASIGFQATVQVRNKLLAAYKDIMSMPV